MTQRLTPASLKAFPKVELHIHVEACISPARIEELAAAAGEPMLRPKDELFTFDNLAEFLAVYEWWCALLRTPEIAEQVAYDAARLMHEDGVVYAEVLTGPRYWTRLDYPALITALGKGYERARRDGYTDCYITPSISREQPAEWALELLDWIDKQAPARVVGIGLDGNEAVLGRTCEKFEGVFERVREMGLGTTAHSGESSGPEGVWDALSFLKLDRIDHGVRASEDPELVQRLADDQVTLNICPTSNVCVGLYDAIDDMPIADFMAAGVPVTINSDDPETMNTRLSAEFEQVGAGLGWELQDVAGLTKAAINAAFCSDARAAELRAEVDAFMAGQSEGQT